MNRNNYPLILRSGKVVNSIGDLIDFAYENSIGNIDIICDEIIEKKGLRIKIIDNGFPFNPLLKEEPDLNVSIEEREIGGLGIFLVKNVMDKIDYKRENKKNIIILEKYL